MWLVLLQEFHLRLLLFLKKKILRRNYMLQIQRHVTKFFPKVTWINFDGLLTVHLSILISVINQLDAQNFCFTVSLFHASTYFEHMCSSSGGQNCITQPLVSSHSAMQFWPPDDEHMCSKHVQAWNKLNVKQKYCATKILCIKLVNYWHK